VRLLTRQTALGVALVAAMTGALTGTALADVSPSPTTASAAPSGVSPSPSAPTPTPLPSTDLTAPDHGTRPSASPLIPVVGGPTTTALPTGSGSPSPTVTFVPSQPSDGVGLLTGQVDQYLALSAQREVAAVAADKAAAALASAQAIVVALQTDQVRLAVSSDAARSIVTSTQANTDDVAAQLYQQGDGGLGAIATIVTSGPDFLSSLSNVTYMHDVANGAVMDSLTARAELDQAVAQESELGPRLAAARAAEVKAGTANDAAQAALAAIDAQLTALDVTPPQVAVGPDGCPTADIATTLRGGAQAFGAAALCRKAVAQAATPQAALAITWAFQHLGASYACGGSGRLLPFRADCSSFVSRAYHEGAGLATAGQGWAPSTRNMVPWDGVALDPHYAYVAPTGLRPGDLVLYDTCPQGGCAYKHVVMYLGSPDGGKTFWMIHTNACGDVAKVEPFWGFPTSGHPFLVARRVVAQPGETVTIPTAAQAVATRAATRVTATRALITSKRIG